MNEEFPVAEAVVIRPADTLVLRMDRYASYDEALRIHERVMERFPLLADVIVLYGFEQIAVCRGNDTGVPT